MTIVRTRTDVVDGRCRVFVPCSLSLDAAYSTSQINANMEVEDEGQSDSVAEFVVSSKEGLTLISL